MAVPIPEACTDCWQGKLEEARQSSVAKLCPLLARAALVQIKEEVGVGAIKIPDTIDVLIERQAGMCRGIGGCSVAQYVEGPRKAATLAEAKNNLVAA